ncbi:MAG: VOC family protein [Actinobacteria bacterium]|nr:VOC family protein [Actinomycetota bacterium]
MLFEKPIAHLGFAVPDVEVAVAHWVETAGAGPFCRIGNGPLRLRDTTYEGAPARWSHSTSTGQWGDLLLELFESHEAEPAGLAEALGIGSYGLHHVGWFVEDLEAESARLERLGAPLILAAGINEQDFAFHDARALIGVRVELYRKLPRVAEHYAAVRRAAVGWDGTDPLLPLAEFRARYGSDPLR